MILENIKKHKKALDVVFKRNKVVLAYIYGSVAKEKESSLSDIDIAVLLSNEVKKNKYFDLRIKISMEIDRILKTGKTEVVCLNQVPSLLKHRAVYHGILIYDAENLESDFELQVLQEYEDFRYHLENSYKIMEKQIKNGTFGNPLTTQYNL